MAQKEVVQFSYGIEKGHIMTDQTSEFQNKVISQSGHSD
jgi:hypothetical protein